MTATRARRSGRRGAAAGPGPMDTRRLGRVLEILQAEAAHWNVPIVSFLSASGATPFHVLVGGVISARTADQTTAGACERLFALVGSPKDLAALPVKRIEQAIKPAGFYPTKAKNLKKLGETLVVDFGGKVPDDLDALTTLPGVGRKTANLVLTEGFRKPAICVDTHVHRISNLWGYVDTKTPEQTERVLREKLPKRHWPIYTRTLIAFGQAICRPQSPWCSRCPVERYCPKIGVTRTR